MTVAQLDVFARRAVSQLAAIDPNGAAETMRRLDDAREAWRLACMAADDEIAALHAQLDEATSELARERIENADLRRHLQTLQTELLRFEEAV